MKFKAASSQLVAFFLLLACWELGVLIFRPSEIILPSPMSVLTDLAQSPNFYLTHAADTVINTLIAFFLSTLIGSLLAIAIVHSQLLERTLYTALIALNNVPKVALAPLFVIWLGTGNYSKIAMAFLIAVFPVIVNGVLGLKALPLEVIELGRSLGGSKRKILLKLRLPNALPSMFAGMKVSVALSLVGVIVGEFVAAQKGLGFAILSAQGLFRTDRVFGAILLLAVIGTLLFYAVEFAERLVVPWHISHRRKAV